MDAYHNLAVSYDRLTNDVDYEATVDFYYEILKREGLKPRTAVDLACGTGSVTAILARKGLQVIGVDLSEEMLTVAQQKAAELDNQPQFVCQPLQELYLPRGVDMAVCALDSLDYITDPASCAEAIRRVYMDLFQRRGEVWERSFEEHREYAYSQEQLVGYLKAAGFTHIRVYADRLFEAPREGEQRIYIKARKGKIK